MSELERVERKLKILNLNRCMNCSAFVSCVEPLKEDIADCDHFDELPDEEQVGVVTLGKSHD